jgi:hypothetical protein
MPYKNKEKIIEYQKEFQKKYRLENKENATIYRKNNKLKLKENRLEKKENKKEYDINYRKKNLEKRMEYQKNRRKTDPLFKLRCNISSLICISIKNKGYTKKSKTFEILGCSYKEFKQHLQRQFTKGMTWDNQGEWHLDHIYPVSLAKDEQELIKLNRYTNFQPMWAVENISKGNKIIPNTQIKLI